DCPPRPSGNTRRAPVRTRNFGGAAPPSTATPTVRIAAPVHRDKRCLGVHFGPTVLGFSMWPATRPSGLRIAGTNLIAALRRTVPPGPRVSAGNADCAAARSPAGRMPYARQRASDTIKTCAITPTDFALRVI